jgi:hypothetical protein
VLQEGRFPLVLSDRTIHLDRLEAVLKEPSGAAPFTIYESGMGKKRRQAIRDEIDRVFSSSGRAVLLATAA